MGRKPLNRNVAVGDRFEAKDSRDEGKVIEVVAVSEVTDEVQTVTEVHPKTPTAVGIKNWMTKTHLLRRYKRISR